MEQLKNYITLITYNQILGWLHNNNRVFFNRDNGVIFLDGDWWRDFVTSHTLDISETILLHLRTRFKVNQIRLLYENDNIPTACFTWNDNAKMYIGGHGGCCGGE